MDTWCIGTGSNLRPFSFGAPAYDLVSTIPYIEDENAALKFARTKRFDGYTSDELSYLGRQGPPAWDTGAQDCSTDGGAVP